MASSPIDICNMALDHLNQENITSLDENTKSAKKCKMWYDDTRRALLMNLNATFSIERGFLSEIQDYEPIYGYDKAYALPPDCLQVLNLGSPIADNLYQIEGKNFYCTYALEDVGIRYIKDVEDVKAYDSEFVKLFALALAEEICIPLTEDWEKKRNIMAMRKEKYIECSTKYGRDNRITVINKPRYREAKIFAEIENTNNFLR